LIIDSSALPGCLGAYKRSTLAAEPCFNNILGVAGETKAGRNISMGLSFGLVDSGFITSKFVKKARSTNWTNEGRVVPALPGSEGQNERCCNDAANDRN